AHTTGFNGDGLIEATDTPPMGGGNLVVRIGPGGAAPGVVPTPEQAAAMHQSAIQAAREEFARLTLGMFASSFSAFPLDLTYGGRAQSPAGNADVLGVKGADGFDAKLFVDGKTHLPLMLSWMAKEPMRITNTDGPGRAGGGGGAN